MFLGQTNLKLWVSLNAIVLELDKITETRKEKFNIEMLNILKEF